MSIGPFLLINAKVRDNAIRAVRCAPVGYRVTIAEPKRSPEQNDGFHPRIREIARTIPFAGKMRSEDEWRKILMSGFRTWQGEQAEVAEGLEGEFIALGLSTRKLSKSEASDFTTYIEHVAATRGVTEAA